MRAVKHSIIGFLGPDCGLMPLAHQSETHDLTKVSVTLVRNCSS